MAGVAVTVAGAGARAVCVYSRQYQRRICIHLFIWGFSVLYKSIYSLYSIHGPPAMCCLAIFGAVHQNPTSPRISRTPREPYLATLAENNSSSKTHSLACSRWCVSYGVVCDLKIKNGRRMTHTCSTETYMMHTRCPVRHTRVCTVLPFARRVMLSDHQPGRGIS